jgi:adenylate kinase
MAAKKSVRGFSVLITGVPGTGKSTIAKMLAKEKGAALIDINKLAGVLKLYSGVDSQDGAKIVKLDELASELSAAIKAEKKSKPVIVEGHLGCEMKLPVQKVIVLRCEPKTLRARLASRNYPQEKVAQNALSEALDYCTVLSEKNYGEKKVWEIDTTGLSEKQVLAKCISLLSGKKMRKEKVSFPDALLREAISGEKIRKAMKGA